MVRLNPHIIHMLCQSESVTDCGGKLVSPMVVQDTSGAPLLVHCCPTGLLPISSLLVQK